MLTFKKNFEALSNLRPRPEPKFLILVVKCSKPNLLKRPGQRVTCPQSLFYIKPTQSLKDSSDIFLSITELSNLLILIQAVLSCIYMLGAFLPRWIMFLSDIFSLFEVLAECDIHLYGYNTWTCFCLSHFLKCKPFWNLVFHWNVEEVSSVSFAVSCIPESIA